MAMFEADKTSSGDASRFNYLTWRQLHIAWWSSEGKEAIDVLPLTKAKIDAMGGGLESSRIQISLQLSYGR